MGDPEVKVFRGHRYVKVKRLWFDHVNLRFGIGYTYVVDFAARRHPLLSTPRA